MRWLSVAYRPGAEERPFLDRAQTQKRAGLEVTMAVPSDVESARFFGVRLARRGVQPVWIRVVNRTGTPVRLDLYSIDAAYYTPLEAAYVSHFSLGKRLLSFGLLECGAPPRGRRARPRDLLCPWQPAHDSTRMTGGDRADRPLRGGVCALVALALLLARNPVARSDELSAPQPAAGDESDPGQTSPEGDEADSGVTGRNGPLTVDWSAGLHVTGKWEYLHVKIGGDLQNDTAGYVDTGSAQELLGTEIDNGVEWRRARLYAEGRILRRLEFNLRYDFTAGNPPNLQDAYFSLVNLPIPTAGLTVGRFLAPHGLDGYTGADDVVFMEKSLMTEAFLPSRNTGFMLNGDSPRKRVRWSFAVLQPEAEDVGLSSTDDLGWSARFAWAFTKGKERKTLVHLLRLMLNAILANPGGAKPVGVFQMRMQVAF